MIDALTTASPPLAPDALPNARIPAKRRWHLVLNARSGASADGAPTAPDLVARLRAAGLDADTGDDPEATLAQKVEAAIESGAEVIVAAGGDGTITAVASALVGTDRTLALLPLGTANLLARDLGVPLDLDAAIAALATMAPKRIDVGEVNGTVFLHKIVLGFVPGLAAARERLRGRGFWASFAFLRHFVRRARRARRISAHLTTGDGRRRVVRAAAIAVSNNAYDEGVGRFFCRSRLDGGSLGLYVLRRPGLFTMVKLAAGMLVGRWRRSEELWVGAAKSVVLRSRRRRLMLMVDGEVSGFSTPLKVRIRPQALSVLAPAAGPDASG